MISPWFCMTHIVWRVTCWLFKTRDMMQYIARFVWGWLTITSVQGFPIKLSLFSHDNVTFPFQFVTCSYDIVTFSFQYAIQSFQFVSIYSSIVFNHTEYLGIRPRRAFWRYVMNPIRYFMYIHIQFFNNNVQETWYLLFLRESGDTQMMRFCIRNPTQQRRWVYIKTNKKQYYCIIFIFLTLSCVHYSIYWMYILTLILCHWQLIYRMEFVYFSSMETHMKAFLF